MAAEDSNPTMVAVPDVAADDTNSPDAEKTGADRRAHRRLRPHELQDLRARLASGADIRLIDLSRGGAQFETDRRFLPNSSIALRLVTKDSTLTVNGRVVRSRIVRLEQGGLGYNVAVSFLETLTQPIEGGAAPVQAATPAAPPAAAADQATPAPAAEGAIPVRLGGGSPVELVSAADAAVEAVPYGARPIDPPRASGAPVLSPPATAESAHLDDAVSGPVRPTAFPSLPTIASEVTADEQAAFEATVVDAPPMLTVTAEVTQSSEELRDLFNGNDW